MNDSSWIGPDTVEDLLGELHLLSVRQQLVVERLHHLTQSPTPSVTSSGAVSRLVTITGVNRGEQIGYDLDGRPLRIGDQFLSRPPHQFAGR